MKFYFTFLLILILAALPAFFSILPVSPEKFENETLSLKEALGQTLLIGFEGKVMTPELETLIKKIQPGGVLLLARNIENKEQVKKLVEDLKSISPTPLFIAVDQEGGLVSRLWWVESTAQSDLKNEIDALKTGTQRAEELQALGINMNLAPVLDSADSKDYLFSRSFKDIPLFSSLFAFTLIQGHQKEGVVSVPKHYPGYDNIYFNPETSTVPHVKEFPKAEAFSNLFFRFTPQLLMLSHVVYEDVDTEYPLPLSKQGILKVKENIGDNVILMSDDLLSVAFINQYSLQELGFGALLSGVDILLAVGYPNAEILGEFYKELWVGAKENPILAERIQNSAKKILKLKLALFEGE